MGAFSLRHDQQRPLVVETIAKSHPILRGLPDRWETISEELYELEQVWPQMTPLAQAYSPESKKFQPLIWTNTYGKARVFVTSLGHNTAMIANREYLDLVSRGLLWTLRLLQDDGTPAPGYSGNEPLDARDAQHRREYRMASSHRLPDGVKPRRLSECQ